MAFVRLVIGEGRERERPGYEVDRSFGPFGSDSEQHGRPWKEGHSPDLMIMPRDPVIIGPICTHYISLVLDWRVSVPSRVLYGS